jgi:hypothetical protein
MRITLTFCIICLAFCTQAQSVDFGKIKADPNFDCNNYGAFDSSMFGESNICQSKNQLEIRLSTGFPGGNASLIILTYNDSIWNIKKYRVQQDGTIGTRLEIVTFVPNPNVTREIHNYEYEQVFDSLKQYNIFLLPNQSELKCDESKYAFNYRVIFKVNNSFGDYSFLNPKTYAAAFPNVKEFSEYLAIYETLNSFFN